MLDTNICIYTIKKNLLIAAHARSLSITLVTNNTKEFERVPELNLENWV
jgi:tRNA(fMet)-specific endonuclease VapC